MGGAVLKLSSLRLPMTNVRLLLLLGWITFALSCGEQPTPPNPSTNGLKDGSWQMEMDLGEDHLVVRWDIQDSVATLVNGGERIEVGSVKFSGDSLAIVMPRYNSAFHGQFTSNGDIVGHWHNFAKDDYSIPFVAFHKSDDPWAYDTSGGESLKYEVTFSPNSEDEYPAIGMLTASGTLATGTFLTETGDYRYLQGTLEDDDLTLSCFDGAHMFLFKGQVSGDSITDGVFYSGTHWKEPWIGYRNELAELTHPDSLTYMVDGHTTLSFSAKDARGGTVEVDKSFFTGYVTIVQVFGTWCPNCYDENVFYKELYLEYQDDGLRILPVAFEKGDTYEEHREAVVAQFQELIMPYPVLIGGKSSKQLASEMFPQVNEIISFPTSFFIDRSGTVRKIHTGFYGPGTGRYYKEYTANTHEYIQDLLSEDMMATR